MPKPNVVFVMGFVQNKKALSKNKVLTEKYGERRAFYSCNKTDIDYLKYVDTGSKEPLDHVAYSGDNEKSSGAFNKDGLMSRKAKAELRQNLRATESVIWHGIISFEEAFGKRYMPNHEQALRLMKIEFPKFLKHAGFDPDKVDWFAGLHENTKYRHIHYSFYEKEPSRYTPHKKGLHFSKGQIPKYIFDRFKVRVEQRLTDISAEIRVSRTEVTDIMKNLLFTPQSHLRYRQDIQSQLERLLLSLPKDGRLSYESENMQHLKPSINKVIDSMLKINKPLYEKFNLFCHLAMQKDKNTIKILNSNKIKKSAWARYMTADNTLNDLYSRLGNLIIKSVRSVKAKERPARSRLAKKSIGRKSLKNLIASITQLNAEFEHASTEAFKEFLRKLDEEKYINGEQNEME